MKPKRLAIFAHFDAQNEVKKYIIHFLRHLRADCDEIHFVSTSALPESEQEKLGPYCSRIFLKENSGFDFGMWKHALAQLDLSEWQELVLTNSSILGPLFPLSRSFRQMEEVDCDFWGMTDNVEIAWHLQSYFLVFRQKALGSESFRLFWDSVLPYKDKTQVIRSYEVGLSTFLVENGLRAKALVPIERVFPWARKSSLRNPTCYRPVRLIREGMPFVKLELLRDNPTKIRLAPVYRCMREAGFDIGLVQFDRAPKQKRNILTQLGSLAPGSSR